MKQHVRAGVLAGLLMTPAALASANEQFNPENPELTNQGQEIQNGAAVVHPLMVNPQTVEQAAAPTALPTATPTSHTATDNSNTAVAPVETQVAATEDAKNEAVQGTEVAAPNSAMASTEGEPFLTTAAVSSTDDAGILAAIASEETDLKENPTIIDIDLARVKELENLGEASIIYDFQVYMNWVEELQKANLINEKQVVFFIAKLTYLKQFAAHKKEANLLREEIQLLKATNSNTIEFTNKLQKKLINLEGEYKETRAVLQEAFNTFELINKEQAENSIKSLPSFLDTTESFLNMNISNYTTFLKFKQDITKPSELLKLDVPTSSSETLFTKLLELDSLPTEEAAKLDYATVVKTAYDELINFYTLEFSTTEKQIFESHQLKDGRTVKQVLEAFNKDITAASKVEVAIVALTPNGITAAQFNSKMKSMLASYDKLTDRQRLLVESYDDKIKAKVDADAKNDGLESAYSVSLAITSLKPTNTEAYRENLFNANISYQKLSPSMQAYIKNWPNLTAQLDEFKAIVGEFKVDADTNELLKNTETGKILIDYDIAPTVEGQIAALSAKPDAATGAGASLLKIVDARAAYNALTSAQKKLINNYKELQEWEAASKSSLSLYDQIEKITFDDEKKFASAVTKAKTAASKLNEDQLKLVTNYERLLNMLPFAETVTAKNALKVSNKPDYRNKVKELYLQIIGLQEEDGTLVTAPTLVVPTGMSTKDSTGLQSILANLKLDIEGKYAELLNAKNIEALIERAVNEADLTKQSSLAAIARANYAALSSNAKKIVNNLTALTNLEKTVKQPQKVIETINAASPDDAKFSTKAKSAVTAYDKLTADQKKYIPDFEKAKIEDFRQFMDFDTQVKALKITSATFRKDLVKAQEKYAELNKSDAWKMKEFDSAYTNLILDAIEALNEQKIEYFDEAVKESDVVIALIEQLAAEVDGNKFRELVDLIDYQYSSNLSADGKKQVTNYKLFQTLKKDGQAAFKVVDMILNPVILSTDVANSGYEKAIANAIKAYDRLTPNQKRYVYNYDSRIVPQLAIYDIVAMINKLKPTSKTYMEDVNAIRQAYDNLTVDDQNKLEPIYYKISGAESGLTEVTAVMNLIDEARPDSEDYVIKLRQARDAYDRLARVNSAYQKLVLNYKTLQQREKELKPVLTSIYEIEELSEILARPFNEASVFVKKYQTAVKSYEKIPYENRELVHNREYLLTTIYPIASTMEAITKIKSSSKTFGTDVAKAREWYELLSSADKELISNYRDLLAFEQIVGGGLAVDQLILAIPETPASQYMQAIRDARAAYNKLTSEEKRAVSLYKELQGYEKGVKNVLAAIDAIDNLQFATNLVSAYDKATKALEKLTADERQMVNNVDKLQSVGPAMEVYKQIENLKPSQEGYSGAVQAVFAAYNRLTTQEKQFVTNFSKLQEAKNNIDTLANVIAKITAITPGSRDYAKQVQEALALYNTLPAALKKLVPNYEMLSGSQKELIAAEKVRSMINEINENATDFVQRTLAARKAYDGLTSNEKLLVSNYFLLEDLEYKLGNMF